jgi:hypothetical protein
MWNTKVPETISEHPEEEDKESNKLEELSESYPKSSKGKSFLELRKSQNSDTNQLFREKKINSLRNKTTTIPLEDRPSYLPNTKEEVNIINTG